MRREHAGRGGRTGSLARGLVAAMSAALVLGIGAQTAALGAAGPVVMAYVTGATATGSEVWVRGVPGTASRSLGPGNAPLLAPNGGSIAVSSVAHRGGALTIYSSDGRGTRGFFDVAKVSARAAAWSPDSRYLAIVVSSADPSSSVGSGLFVFDTASNTMVRVSRGPINGASFAADGSDRIAYARAAALGLRPTVDVYIGDPDGRNRRRVTRDGRSLNPVWGAKGIAFDRQRLRREDLPAYQVWLMQPSGRGQVRLTNVRVGSLQQGLVPKAFSGDGTRLLAEYEGLNTSRAWVITLGPRRVRELKVAGRSVSGYGISRDGVSVLVDAGGFLNPPDRGRIESVAFFGGRAKVLVPHGSEPSWNG